MGMERGLNTTTGKLAKNYEYQAGFATQHQVPRFQASNVAVPFRVRQKVTQPSYRGYPNLGRE